MPICEIGIAENNNKITNVFFKKQTKELKNATEKETEMIKTASIQLNEYFNGKRKEFNLPIYLCGTEFQNKVWNFLKTIPYGKTASYKEVAEKIGKNKAYRAVGNANNHNPIAIIIPCHRIIGSNGKMTGYAGGIDIKEKLLKLEKYYKDIKSI